MSKTALIVEGGGMKCAYSASVLDKFIDDNITFDYCIGVSAGSANAYLLWPDKETVTAGLHGSH